MRSNTHQTFPVKSLKFKQTKKGKKDVNMYHLTGSDFFFTLKLESVSKITIFDLKMMVKNGLEKIFLKFLHAEAIFF